MRKFKRVFATLLFVIKQHGEQKRKYTGQPYWYHLVEVAYLVYKTTKDEISTVVALGHDLLEDTECTHADLDRFFNRHYAPYEVDKIIYGIEQLTDEYIRVSYPELNRKRRKRLEAERLGRTPDWIQTIKYSDLISNSKSITRHDKDFAVVYLREKEELLNEMKKGSAILYVKAIKILDESKQELNIR